MKELIKITEGEGGKRAVSARELHAFLESKQDFSTWIKNRIEKYDLVENVDFITAPQIYGTANGGHATRIEYALTVDAAEELSMVEGNEKGKEARKYFISCEKIAKKQLLLQPTPNFSNPAEAARAWADEYERRIQASLLLEVKSQQLDESKEWYSIKRWAKDHNLNWRTVSWRALKAISYEHDYAVKKIFDANYGEVNTYHKNVFDIYSKGISRKK